MSAFNGFPKATFAFLKGLKTHNSRDWFEDHRTDYEDAVLGPTQAFIATMADPLAEMAPRYTADPKVNGSFRRLNRDVRFSKDKTPYTPRIHMIFWSGEHPNRAPALHFVLHPDGFGYGAGEFQWTKDALDTYRTAVRDARKRAALEAALATAEAIGCTRDEPPLKKPAGGVDMADPAALHLRHKALVVRTLTDRPLPKEVGSSDFTAHVAHIARALSPMNVWLKEYL